MSDQKPAHGSGALGTISSWPSAAWATEYWVDAVQRGILFLDVLRERGNQHFTETARIAPNVLSFNYELVLDGRTFDRGVNYGLTRIVPPQGTIIDPKKRPFIVFDPRAGHGPGIGGMKQDSEIGVVLKAGHPCYFVGFLPDPVPGQTIEDVCLAEARFIEAVIARHPEAASKPCLIGNCQAGWQIMMTGAMRPDLPGPMLLAGSPLSYWGGARGKRSLRYLGGLLGGTWLTTLCGDLGNGIFDGANLVANFELLHPDNTFWTKPYNLYSQVDTESARFLAFERYWGSPVKLNAQEMQFITDQLFVGNKLSTGQLRTSDGLRLDLRNITSPIIVFCSHGDDITPPQQALGWILDLYQDEMEIVRTGQTIIYCLHPSIGHLGIFVSGKVATKEHEEFANAMDMIDLMPPGLYEAIITDAGPDTARPDLVHGNYLFTLEARRLDDIKSLGFNDLEDDMRFETAARISEINQGLYRTSVEPMMHTLVTAQSAEWLQRLHPHRVRFEIFSDRNPLMAGIAALAPAVRKNRQAVSEKNPFVVAERLVSQQIVRGLQTAAEWRDRCQEVVFTAFYGAPLLQAAVGLRGAHATPPRHAEHDWSREAAAQRAQAGVEASLTSGGAVAAAVRAMLFVQWPARRVDERAFAAMQAIAAKMPPEHRVGSAQFKKLLHDQFLLLLTEEKRAIEALPLLVPDNRKTRDMVVDAVRQVVTSGGALPATCTARLVQVEALLGAKAAIGTSERPPREPAHV